MQKVWICPYIHQLVRWFFSFDFWRRKKVYFASLSSQSGLGAAAGSYSTDYRRYPMRRRCLAPRSTFGKSFPKSNPSLRFAARFDRLCRRWRRRRGRAFSSRELAAARDGIVNVNSLFTITAFIGLAWRPSGLRRWSRASDCNLGTKFR